MREVDRKWLQRNDKEAGMWWSPGRGWVEEKRGTRGHGVGREWGPRAEAVRTPFSFSSLVPKGPDVSSHLSRWLWKVGRWGGQSCPPGGPIFSQQPEAGQHCGVDSAWLCGALHSLLDPSVRCWVWAPSPTFNSSLFGSFLSCLGAWSKGPGQGGAGTWSLLGQGLTRGGTSFRTTPGTRGFLGSERRTLPAEAKCAWRGTTDGHEILGEQWEGCRRSSGEGMAPTPVLLPGKSHGRRSLVGCSPWGR